MPKTGFSYFFSFSNIADITLKKPNYTQHEVKLKYPEAILHNLSSNESPLFVSFAGLVWHEKHTKIYQDARYAHAHSESSAQRAVHTQPGASNVIFPSISFSIVVRRAIHVRFSLLCVAFLPSCRLSVVSKVFHLSVWTINTQKPRKKTDTHNVEDKQGNWKKFMLFDV